MTNIVLEKRKSCKRTCKCIANTREIRLVADYEHNAVVELFMTNNGYLFIHILTVATDSWFPNLHRYDLS